MSAKLTLQPAADGLESEHAGSARSRWPPDTDSVTGGGPPALRS